MCLPDGVEIAETDSRNGVIEKKTRYEYWKWLNRKSAATLGHKLSDGTFTFMQQTVVAAMAVATAISFISNGKLHHIPNRLMTNENSKKKQQPNVHCHLWVMMIRLQTWNNHRKSTNGKCVCVWLQHFLTAFFLLSPLTLWFFYDKIKKTHIMCVISAHLTLK